MKNYRTKAKIAISIIAALVAVVALSLFIANVFIPVKYLKSYCVKGKRAEVGIMRISFLSLSGSCTVIELPDGKNMLIDAGDGSYASDSSILQNLNSKNIEVIDYLLCLSVNKEHCGGIAEILKYKTVKNIFMPYCEGYDMGGEFQKFTQAAADENAGIFYNEYSAGASGEDWFFTLLSPRAVADPYGEYAEFFNNSSSLSLRNNLSAVVWLEYAGAGFLFSADAEEKVFKRIYDFYELAEEDFPVNLKSCKIFSLCGEGENSLYAPFYEILKPELTIISSGKSSQSLTDEANEFGEAYKVDEAGTITLTVGSDGKIFRQQE